MEAIYEYAFAAGLRYNEVVSSDRGAIIRPGFSIV